MTLEIITSDSLTPFRHGFFTRRGGASSGIFKGLNCGYGSSDQAAVVSVNRDRVAKAMECPSEDLTTVHQIHSADVVTVTGPHKDPLPKADAMVSNQPGLALCILTADCQPVLFADSTAGVIGAAHAGWKGAMGGILGGVVNAMESLGAKRENITAVVGPCISQHAYEVGQEYFEQFMDDDPENARFFANGENGKYLFDLPMYGVTSLRSAGVGVAEWTGHCTYSDPERFYSYRRSVHQKEADYGRLLSAIRI